MFCLYSHRGRLNQIAKQIRAPFFFYDLDLLENNLRHLTDLPVKLWYAVKANPLSSIVKTIASKDISFDVASIGELDQVLKQGVDPKNILNTGPAKSYEQICYFLEKGVRIFVLESIQQYEDLTKATQKYTVQVKALLRVQISWQESSEKNFLGGNSVTPFGLSPETWKKYFNSNFIDHGNIDILGLHCFQWGNITDVKKLSYLWETITDNLVKLVEQINLDLKVIDLGGGLGIPYNNETKRLTISEVKKVVNQLKVKYAEIDFWLELGRFAVGECGVYVTKIIDKKETYGKNLLVLEGGSQHLIRPFITGQAFPVYNISSENTQKSKVQELHGPLCTSIDHLGSVDLPSCTRSGDNLVFKQTGAYGFTESMPFFLCHTLPAEIVYSKGQICIIRAAKNAQEWLR